MKRVMTDEQKAKMLATLAAARAARGQVVAREVEATVPERSQESDQQIRIKLAERFSAMDKMTQATFAGYTRSLIVSGPAGLGKSYGVMRIADTMESQGKNVERIAGNVRATGLYKALYENRHPDSVLIFDDADSIFGDDISLNLLKGACDMTRRRMINWRAETKMENEDGERLPTQFQFEGSIIFITNMNFDHHIAKGTRLAPHFEAMVSRSMYLDLGMNTKRDYLVRIQMVVEEGMLVEMGLNETDAQELLMFIEHNVERLRELSLRMVVKLSSLMAMDRSGWQRLARVTCFRGLNG